MAKSVTVNIVFGEEAVNDLENEGKVTEEVADRLEQFEFATDAEATAFLAGVEAACGWLKHYVPSDDEVRKIRRKQAKIATARNQVKIAAKA